MDKNDKLEQFIKDQINSIEVNEGDRMWKEYQKKFNFPKNQFPYILSTFFLVGTILAGYWATNNIFYKHSQDLLQKTKIEQASTNGLLIKEKEYKQPKSENVILVEDDEKLPKTATPNVAETNNNLNSIKLNSFENRKEVEAVNKDELIKDFNETVVLGDEKTKVKNEQSQSIILRHSNDNQINNFSSNELDSSENVKEDNEVSLFKYLEKDDEIDLDKDFDKVKKDIDKTEVVKDVNVIEVSNSNNGFGKNEETQLSILNKNVENSPQTKKTFWGSSENIDFNKETNINSQLENITKIEPKKLLYLENSFSEISLPGLQACTKNKILKPWFVEYQFSRSFNGIQQQSIGLGKSVYKKANHGLDIITGLQYDFGYILSMDSVKIIRAISITEYRTNKDLNYLWDAFVTGLYTYEYQNFQLAAGTKINYGIFNQHYVDEIYKIKHNNELGSGTGRSLIGMKENNYWQPINRFRFNIVLRSSYQWKRFLLGFTASKQLNDLIKNDLAVSNKTNNPIQVGLYLRYNFKSNKSASFLKF